MPAEPAGLAPLALGFLLALARVSAVFAFVPFTGWKGALDPARTVLVLGTTIALASHWPRLALSSFTTAAFVLLIVREATLGLAVGIATGLLLEAFVLGAQLIAIQAGYSYASTIDPNSQADSNVLQVLTQLAASLLFLTLDLDRHLIRSMASTLDLGGQIASSDALWRQWSRLVELGAAVWVTALRLAAPLLLLLLLVDLALSCLGRINSQLQLLSVAFPAKILATIALLAVLAGSIPLLFRQHAERFAATIEGGRP